ncbi:hypothetical protein [Microbacterium paraoxydans]|uniref:hypothetical protein n=1 Tax=Microbacterium paraoxydans TaxID=199592 RepID=UPI001CF9D0AA|nr:hypothetical protein [Microbacterium paraoxydans]
MTTKPTITEPSPFNCRRGRHCVLTTDRICVICGAQGVTDARRLPPLTEPPQPTALAAAEPLSIVSGTESDG